VSFHYDSFELGKKKQAIKITLKIGYENENENNNEYKQKMKELGLRVGKER
jgi:hypothetical protein